MASRIISIKKKETIQPVEVESQDEIVTESLAHAARKSLENASNRDEIATPSCEEEKAVFFQALGTIEAERVEVVERKIIITVGSKEYRGWIESRQFSGLMRYLEERGEKPIYLKVYPKTFSTPEQPLCLQGWQIVIGKKGLSPQEKVNHFVIRGVWQYIPQSESPVMTIYRNQTADDPTLKYKATHLPIVMEREDCKAFKYDPEAKQKRKRYFIQGLFQFDPSSNLFIWKEDLEPPTLKIPPYLKADKTPLENEIKIAKKDPEKPKEAQFNPPIAVESPIIMLEGKVPEVTIKFSQKPEIPSEGKTVTLQIKGENGISVRAAIARKNLSKQIEKMESFEEWVAALSGKMVEIAPDGVIELEGAGINVFEKKGKEVEKEKTAEGESN
jgi:hypothetical protein